MRSCAAWLVLLGALLGTAGADPGKEEAGAKNTPQRIEAPAIGLDATFDLPEGWSSCIETGAGGFDDPKIREEIMKTKQLPNGDFEVERGWWNNGEILAQMRLRLGRKEFRGTLRELADRCISEIREKWPAFKATKPAEKNLALGSVPALYVTLESKKEPPYRVHFVVLLADGKGCGLFCYGWGPQVNVVDLSNGQMPDSVRKIAEESRRLPPEKLKKQTALFREFETVVAPTLRVVKRPVPEPTPPEPGR